MKYAIIAAGEGSRLAQEGITVPKPLVEVNGETLIGRLLRIFSSNNAEGIVAITRSDYSLENEVEKSGLEASKFHRLVKATPSSMHSFFEMSPFLEDSPFIMTTVDTFFDEAKFSEYVSYFEKAVAEGYDGVMAVTDYIEDEKPLYVKASPSALPRREGTASQDFHSDRKGGASRDSLLIEGFLDADPEHKCTYISAGIYGLTPKALNTLRRCMAEGQSRMRNFQRGLITDGLRLLAFPLGKVIDIDHASDIKRVEWPTPNPSPAFVVGQNAEGVL